MAAPSRSSTGSGRSGNGREPRRPDSAHAAQVAHLQAQIARMREDRSRLEGRLDEALTENKSLRADTARLAAQLKTWRRSANRERHVQFWLLFERLGSSWNDIEDYAGSVNHDLSRLAALAMLGELRASGTDPQVVQHAEQIVDLFDPIYYLTEQPNLNLSGGNPLHHYITVGFAEGRQPNPLFDPRYYRGRTAPIEGDPLLHYIRSGAAAGLKPHPLFDGAYYWDRNPEIRESGVNPLFHYQVWGCHEGRDPSPLFDTAYYLDRAGDAPSLTGNPLHDYLLLGREAADPHPLFSNRYVERQLGSRQFADAPLFLYESEPELWRTVRPHPLFDLGHLTNVSGIELPDDASPLSAYCRFGEEHDIDPSALFDSSLYRYQIEKEQGATLSDPPIIDYLKRGYKDKTLRPNFMFDPAAYLSRNHLEIAGPELVHYCLVGDRNGYYCQELFCAGFYNAARTDDLPITALEHFLLSDDDSIVESHPHIARPLDRRAMRLVSAAARSSGDFDPDFYRASYPDLRPLTASESRGHFYKSGKAEGRFGSPRQILESVRLCDVPAGFFADEYLALNPDLRPLFRSDYFPLLRHYLTDGHGENRRIGRWQFHLDLQGIEIPTTHVPVRVQANSENIDVCVLIHIFYDDLWPELAGFANSFSDVSRDVFINVVDIAWNLRVQRELRELCPGAFVQLSNDNGRDIGGFVRLLDNVDIERYNAFAFMHSKKSPHISPERGTHWRRSLLSAFAGSRDIAAEAVRTFHSDPTVGLIAAKEWRATDLGNNLSHYYRLLDYFEIGAEHRDVEYLSGTMFLIRPDIVRRLYDGLKSMEFEYGGDKNLEFHRDGQIAHAVERLIGNLTRQLGYRIQWN
jgi:hypothetical protein